MPLPENLPEKIKLALSIISGRFDPFEVTKSDAELLGIETAPGRAYSTDDVKQAAEEMIFEILMITLPQEPVTIDLWQVTEKLLLEIDAQPEKVLPKQQVKVPDEIVNHLVEDRVIQKTLNGLRWGMNANRALRQIREEREKKGQN